MINGSMDAVTKIVSICLITGFMASNVVAQSNGHDAHIAIDNPATLSKEEALRVYSELTDQMYKGYTSSRLDIISNYQDWPKYNDAPYISATHGQRYVNNYANNIARTYGILNDGGKLAAGSVLAKDSMTITVENRILPGALFVMEKLPEGGSPQTADWRYIMVMPDGSLFGDTAGSRSKTVVYCHDCHKAMASRDFTFYVPEDYRIGK